MADIFKEIEEELRRDRWEIVWKKYGKYVLGVAAVIVIATVAWVAWQKYQLRQDLQVTVEMHRALTAARAGETEQAIEGFAAVTKDGNERQVALALLQEAALRANDDDIEIGARHLPKPEGKRLAQSALSCFGDDPGGGTGPGHG